MIRNIDALRTPFFVFFSVVLVAVYYATIRELMEFSRQSAIYSYIYVIPFISGYFLFEKRQAIRQAMSYSFLPGFLLTATGIFLYLTGVSQAGLLNQNDRLSWMVFSMLLSWMGGFIMFFGPGAFRVALFPLLYLFSMVPVPSAIMNYIITFLRIYSTDVAYGLLRLTGTPVSRDGFLIYFPEMIVEVADECSGIRSSMALFITSLVAGYMFLKKPWKRIVLLLMVVPISVLRNGLRILILSLLGMYVDISFVGDNIAHRRGGVFFFALSVLLLFSVLWLLRDRKARH